MPLFTAAEFRQSSSSSGTDRQLEGAGLPWMLHDKNDRRSAIEKERSAIVSVLCTDQWRLGMLKHLSSTKPIKLLSFIVGFSLVAKRRASLIFLLAIIFNNDTYGCRTSFLKGVGYLFPHSP
jgi:hypothetical protein